MDPIYWTVAAIDAALFAALLLKMIQTPGGSSNGGREMGIFFFGVAPLSILALVSLLFFFSHSRIWRVLALAVALAPGVILARSKLRDALLRARVAKLQRQRGAPGGDGT